MDWRETYKDKLVTAEEAVSHVQPDDKIIFGDWIGEPPALVDALVARASELTNVEIIHGMSPGKLEYLDSKYEGIFHHTSLFLGGKSSKSYRADEGRIDYLGGTTYHKWPDMFAKRAELNPHWAFVQVSEPDEEGNCSYGIDCSFTEPAVRTAERVIVQVNKNFPYVRGTMCNLADVDYIVEQEAPMYEIASAAPSEKIQTIADYVAELVEDGATIQLGIGVLPDAIAQNLKNKKHLGVHSEALTTSIMDLIECGAIDNSRKTLNPGVCVGSQTAGTLEFYQYTDHNPMFALYPVDYVNDPYVIGKNYKQTSINACLEVDLKGQVNSESINGRQYSGIGGQLDHVRGAQLSEGGISILALNSTTKNDEVSKIVLSFAPGNVTTVGRYDTQYIVTEYGVANLRYKTERERAKALIAIAHPKFRDELTFEAKKIGLL